MPNLFYRDSEKSEKGEHAAAVTKEEIQGGWTASTPELTASQSEGVQVPSVSSVGP